jgi:hypothetical protein
VTTFSWQKVMGGEAAHGMLILSPRAVERLESYTPPWPMPKIFRLTKGGKLIEGIFVGETINTPSMLAVEDYLLALDWAQSIGGLPELMARADRNAQAVFDFCAERDWIDNLAADPATRSNTSVCLKFTDSRITDGAGFAKAVAKRLEAEGVALDIGGYRDAPPGLRIWCGATVETSDIEAMLPWLDWAFHAESSAGRSRLIAWWADCEGWARPPFVDEYSHTPSILQGPRPMAPKVLVSDKLSETAVQIFRDRGIDVTFDPSIGKDKDRLLEVIGDYDGLAIRSATKVTEKVIAAASNLKGRRSCRDRRRQRGYPGGVQEGHHRDEHALRELHHHGGTRHRDDVRRRPSDPGGQCLHPWWQVGESPASWGSS